MDTEKVEIDCIPKTDVPYKKWLLSSHNKIGEISSFGEVYQVCDISKYMTKGIDCFYVMKVLENKYSEDLRDVKNREVLMQNKCAEHGLCLKVEDEWDCDEGRTAVIITKLARETLYRSIRNDEKNYNLSLKNICSSIDLIKRLHIEAKIFHGDTHLNNFMFTQDGELIFIDLGKSCFLGEKYGKPFDINNFYENVSKNIIYDYYHFQKNVGQFQSKFYYYFSEKIKILIQDLRASFKEIINLVEKNIEKYGQISEDDDLSLEDEDSEYPSHRNDKKLGKNAVIDLFLDAENRIVDEFLSKTTYKSIMNT